MSEGAMADHVHPVKFDDHGTERTVPVPDSEFRLGPPDVTTAEHTLFTARPGDRQDRAWRQWFEAGNTLSILERARDLATAARADADPPEPISPVDSNITYANTGMRTVRGPAFVDRHGGVAGADVDHRLLWYEYAIGPRDEYGAYDPGFGGLPDDAARDTRWADWLGTNEYHPDLPTIKRQYRFMEVMRDLRADAAGSAQLGVDVPAAPDRNRALELLTIARDDPRVRWGSLILGLLAAGIGFGVGYGRPAGAPEVPGVPGNVQATVGRRETSGSEVTVTWAPPPTGAKPDHYQVQLQPTTGTGGPIMAPPAGGDSTSVVVRNVPDGTYRVEVAAWGTSVSGTPGTTTVTVAPATPVPAATTPPDPPTDVALTAGMSSVSREHGLTATWLPAESGDAATGFAVILVAVTPAAMSIRADVGLMTSFFFPALRDGTYRADVVASNDAGDSTIASSPVTTYAAPSSPPNAPDRPLTNVTTSPTVSGKAKLVVSWTRPATGPDVVGYQVTLTGGGRTDTTPTQTGPMTGMVYDPIDDGTYTVAVVAYNKAGKGPAATVPVTVDHTAIDPKGLDWAPVFGAEQIKEWKAQRDILNDMDEQAEFWPHVQSILKDDKNEHGGLASYETMLFLARLLSRWIAAPAVDPPEPIIVNIANRISYGCTPAFPRVPPPPGSEYADRMAPWRAAVDVTNAAGTAQMPLRYKMFGLTRALERYLGVHA